MRSLVAISLAALVWFGVAAAQSDTNVPVSVRNWSLFPAMIEVDGGFVHFGPFERQELELTPGTKVHRYDRSKLDGRGRLLFVVAGSEPKQRFRI